MGSTPRTGRGGGDTTSPASALAGETSARLQQLYVVYEADATSTDRAGARDGVGDRLPRLTVDAAEVILGREPEGATTFSIADPRVSRVHAAIVRDGGTGTVTIVDRDSRHGTFVDGERVERAKLAHGSVVRIGDTLLVYADTVLRMDEARTLAPETESLRGASLAMQLVRGAISLVGPRNLPVLILGETGVGKERVAQEIHRHSRRSGLLLAVNCASIAPSLAETELFGHAAGAFTGATQKSDGVFVAADKGTLFLDEIAELPLALQPKLLRALATGEVRAVGRTESRTVDVRVVAATHGDVEGAVNRGGFRGDLLARLAGWTLRIPPLRERREDILGLARLFLGRTGSRASLSAGCAEALLLYDWPFNAREVEQTVTAAAIRALDGIVRPEHLPDPIARPVLARAALSPSDPPPPPLLALVPREGIPDAEGLRRVLRSFQGNVAQVASYFRKDRKQIYRWAERLGVDLDAARPVGDPCDTRDDGEVGRAPRGRPARD